MDASERTEPRHDQTLPANSPGRQQIAEGMDVVSIDGQAIGRVKAVRQDDFLVDRPLARDVYVPYRVVMATPEGWEKYRGGPPQPTEVVLSVTAAHVDAEDWPNP